MKEKETDDDKTDECLSGLRVQQPSGANPIPSVCGMAKRIFWLRNRNAMARGQGDKKEVCTTDEGVGKGS